MSSDETEGEQLLDALWTQPGLADLRCLECLQSFAKDALIRTYRVEPSGDHRPGYSTVLSTHRGDILLYDRHLQCCLGKGIKFSAVSLVWDPDISYLQQQRRTLPQTSAVADRIIEISTKIYTGIKKADELATEIWLDYISVPQWSDGLKSNILLVMHQLFAKADTTLIYFDDISQEVIEKLYHNERTPERLEAMLTVCNAKYFQRIWTAMEFARSGRVRMLVGECTYLAGLDDPAFLNRLYQVWNEELSHHESVFSLEDAVHLGENQVPWTLGPLREAKARRKINFAMASALLSKRGCRDQTDYLHALRGIVHVSSDTPMGHNFKTEYYQIAWEALKAGDLSSLLITPHLEMGDPRDPDTDAHPFSYNDVFTWELGEETHPPLLQGQAEFSDLEHTVSLSLEPIGLVSTIQDPWDRESDGPMSLFPATAIAALRIEGPSLDSFVGCMSRIYGPKRETIMKSLQEKNEAGRVAQALAHRFDDATLTFWEVDGPTGAEWLADALSLSKATEGETQSRLRANYASYGTMHCQPFNYVVGVTCMSCHETFMFRAGGFALPSKLRHARAYRIPGLKYKMSNPDGMGVLVKDGRDSRSEQISSTRLMMIPLLPTC